MSTPYPPDEAPTEIVREERTLVGEPPPPPGPPPTGGPPPERRWWLWLVALLVLVLAGLALAYWLGRDDDGDDSPPPAATTTRDTTTTEPTTTEQTTETQETTTQAEAVAVPDLAGLTGETATTALEQAGLSAELVTVESEEQEGTVVAQEPAAGTEVERGATVRVSVAGPPATAAVPDVTGMELADAADALADEDLRAFVRYVPSDERIGTVVDQAREPGSEVERGSAVGVNVSDGGAGQVSLPNVRGREEGEARDALASAGFNVRSYEVDASTANRGRVVFQHPSTGSAPERALILLYVGR
jgi:serine/threonine-protein kinase